MTDNANALRSKNDKRAMQKLNQGRADEARKMRKKRRKRGKHQKRAGNPRSAKRSEPRKRLTANPRALREVHRAPRNDVAKPQRYRSAKVDLRSAKGNARRRT